MKKSYHGKASRSRREVFSPRGKVVQLKTDAGEAAIGLRVPIAELLDGVRGSLEALATEVGVLVVQGLLEEEAEEVAGPRYAHEDGKRGIRWGEAEGHVFFGGRKVALRRPRVRMDDGNEARLERYQQIQRSGGMAASVMQRVLRRVSMRHYEGVLDEACAGFGIRKSSVSRHWKVASATRVQELVERKLGNLDLVAVFIDGVSFKEALLVVALGLDSTGKKHVLGMWSGATENANVVGSLLDDMITRGFPTDRECLFVLDGSKALRAAIVKRFGAKSKIQRCQVHKERNVLEHLPDSLHGIVRMKLRAAWNMRSYEDAYKAIMALVTWLDEKNPCAANSLREGLEDTLMLHRLRVPSALRRSLRTTNPIESCFSSTRDLCRNVKHWKSANMIWRWAGAMLLEAEKHFSRVRGYREIPFLITALRKEVDSVETAA